MNIQNHFRKNKIIIGLSLFLFIALNSNAFNYSVSFTGHGASTDVTSVIVYNTTQGTSVTVPAGQILLLSEGLTTTNDITDNDNGLLYCTSDLQGNSYVSFRVKQAGITYMNVFSIDGRQIAGIKESLSEGSYRYKLTLPKGSFIIQVKGNGFVYNTKTVNQSDAENGIQIVSMGYEKPDKSVANHVKSAAVTMKYSAGDRLLIKGYATDMCTIVADVIYGDKTIDFNFVPCRDADGNNYATVTIGNQVWMAENLKTTKYADGTDIILRASKAEYLADPNNQTTPICRYFNDDPATKDVFGMAYKKQTIDHKSLCPAGWHIPNHYEWRTLRDAVSADGVGRYNAIRKTGAVSEFWHKDGATNASGFSAVGTGGFWDEWYVHEKTWAIWLASDMFNSSATDCWFFYASTDDALTPGSIVCDEIASSALDFITAVRCVKNSDDNYYDVLQLSETPIGLWVTPPAAYQTSEEYGRIKNCGFNFVNGFHYSENVNSRILLVLDYCRDYGLKFFANKAVVANDIVKYSGNPDATLLKKFTDGILPYATHPAFAGELLMDEPGKNLFGAVSAFTGAFKQAFPDKIAHVNLFPSYATGGIQAPNYIDYIDNWIETQSPKHISYDSYPLLSDGTIISDYFYNLDVVRARSRAKEIPFWTFIQTLRIAGTPGVTDKREPSEVDLRWQVWSNLAFGAKGIQYFTYWSPGSGTEQFGEALIGLNGEKTVRYDYVKKLNADINTIGKILLECHAEGVIQTAAKKYNMFSPLYSFGEIISVTGGDNIVGCFQSKEGLKKVLITTLTPDKDADVTFHVSSNVSSVRIWENNVAAVRTPIDNKLTFHVAAGGAILVEF